MKSHQHDGKARHGRVWRGAAGAAILAAAGTMLVTGAKARADTYVWANSNVAGATPASLNWFNPTQAAWTGGTPVSGNANTIQFFQDSTTNFTNNAAAIQISNLDNAGSPFELGTLTLAGKGSATGGRTLTMNLSGDALNFSAATGTINDNASAGAHPSFVNYIIGSNLQLGTSGSAGILTITGTRTSSTQTENFLRINGDISELQSGGGSLVKNNAGTTLILAGVNTFSGGVTINAGNVYAAGASTQVLGTGRLTLNAGLFSLHTSDGMAPSNQTVGSIAGTGGNIRAGNRTLTFGGDNTTTTYQGGWDGGIFTKVGNGTTTVFSAGSTVNVQAVNVNGGTLQLGASKNFGAVAVSVNNGGTLDLNGFNTNGDLGNGGIFAGGAITTGSGTFTNTNQQVFFHNAGTSTFTGNLALTANPFFRGDANATLIVNGVLSGGSGSITNSGNHQVSAVIQLTGTSSNTFTGAWSVGNGTTQLNKSNGATAIPSDVVLSNGTVTWLASNQIADTSNYTQHAGLLNLGGFTETVASFTSANASAYTPSTNGTLTLAGTATDVLTLTSAQNAPKTLDFNLALSGASGGGINLTSAGFNNNVIRIGGAVAGTRTLDLGSVARTVSINDNPDLAVDASITSLTTGSGGLTKTGAGTLELSAANTYGGVTTVNQGVLNLNHLSALQNSTLDTGPAGGQSVVFNLPGTQNLGGLQGTDDLAIGANTISVGANNQSTSYTGVISGVNGKLTKVGSGTLELTNDSSYSGVTNVDGGTLLVNGSITSNTTVNSGGTLGGTGTIIGSLAIASGGTHAPGNSPGIENVVGSYSVNLGGNLVIEVNGPTAGNGLGFHDQVNVTGGVTLAGNLLISTLFYPTGVVAGDQLVNINNDGGDAVDGTFFGLGEGAAVLLNGLQFATISYLGGDGNDVVLTAIPEPAGIMMLTMGFAAVLRRRKRAVCCLMSDV